MVVVVSLSVVAADDVGYDDDVNTFERWRQGGGTATGLLAGQPYIAPLPIIDRGARYHRVGSAPHSARND